MVRTPCCKSEGLKRGTWTVEEDEKLIAYIQEHGEGSWRTLPEKAGLSRCGKSCRLRWTNYLKPDIKRGQFNLEDEEIIIKLHAIKGNKWSSIARRLPGRTDNEIKNYWNTHIKKRLIQNGIDPTTHKPINSGTYKEDTGSTHSPCSIFGPVSDSVPGSVSGSVQLLNRVATKFSLNANRIFLAELIQGAGKKNPGDRLTTDLSPTIVSDGLKPVQPVWDTKCWTGKPKNSTSTSNLSDEAVEISMNDSDSTDLGKYCTDTLTDDFQVVPVEPIGSENLDDSWEAFQGNDFFDRNNEKAIQVMQNLENVFSDGLGYTEELVSIGSYWNDHVELGDFGLMDWSPFLPII